MLTCIAPCRCSAASCRELGSSIYPRNWHRCRAGPPLPASNSPAPPLRPAVQACQHTAGYAHLFTFQFPRFVQALTGCRPLPIVTLMVYVLLVVSLAFRREWGKNPCCGRQVPKRDGPVTHDWALSLAAVPVMACPRGVTEWEFILVVGPG